MDIVNKAYRKSLFAFVVPVFGVIFCGIVTYSYYMGEFQNSSSGLVLRLILLFFALDITLIFMIWLVGVIKYTFIIGSDRFIELGIFSKRKEILFSDIKGYKTEYGTDKYFKSKYIYFVTNKGYETNTFNNNFTIHFNVEGIDSIRFFLSQNFDNLDEV